MKSRGHLTVISAAFPEILEASAELAAAEGDDGVCTLYSPVHARPLEPGVDHYFTAVILLKA
jgi:hypothetical protein